MKKRNSLAIIIIIVIFHIITTNCSDMLNQLIDRNSPCRLHDSFAAIYGTETPPTDTGEPSISATDDCGFVFTCYNRSYGAGGMDYWVVKLDYTGNIQWQKVFGGVGNEWPSSIHNTNDGGFIVCGKTRSLGGVGGMEEDFWLVKLNFQGNIQWQKVYEGDGNECLFSCSQTSDRGYIVAGRTNSFGVASTEIWVLKLSSSGNISWEKTYGGNGMDQANSIRQTADGGYIFCATTDSFGAGNDDILVIKLNPDGSVSWCKTYGGANDDIPYTIVHTSDQGYILSATTNSFGAGDQDIWLIKLDQSGEIVWQKTYGGINSDHFISACVDQSIQQTADGGYIVAGVATSFGLNADYWLLKVDSTGSIQWQKAYDKSATHDAATSVSATYGGYAVIGSSGVSDSAGRIMILNVDLNGNIPGSVINIVNTNATVSNTAVNAQNTAVNVSDTSATSSDSNCDIFTTNSSMDFF
ncbi:MAG: hypothetical protein JW822_14655 [Spirochaetales bacterium]|nr:hypothetical protein [Spirochaetales bacterium]